MASVIPDKIVKEISEKSINDFSKTAILRRFVMDGFVPVPPAFNVTEFQEWANQGPAKANDMALNLPKEAEPVSVATFTGSFFNAQNAQNAVKGPKEAVQEKPSSTATPKKP